MVLPMVELDVGCGRMMSLEMPMNDFRTVPFGAACRMDVLGREDQQSKHAECGKNRDESSNTAS
jgi:hypothetical protein